MYADSNRNGKPDPGELPVAGAVITLTGTDAAGSAVSLTATSNAQGLFSFPTLRGGTYQLVESAVDGYVHGAATPGNAGGTSGGAGSARITGIVLPGAVHAGNYLFAEYSTRNADLSGSVWLDANHNHKRDGAEAGVSGITVELLQGSTIVSTTATAADGSYRFTNVAPGTLYTVRFRDSASGALYGFPVPNESGTPFYEGVASPGNPGGATNVNGVLAGITLQPGQSLIEQSLPLDPTGLVYDAVSRAVVPGATVRLSGPSGFNPVTELVGGAGNATQTVGPSGYYQFLLLSGAPLGTYTIAVTPPANGHYAAIPASGLIPPCAGPYAVGPTPSPLVIQSNETPPALNAPHTCVPGGTSTTYYLAFKLAANSTPLIPVLAGVLRVTKTTPLVNISAGESVPYTITATSTQSREYVGIALNDLMPPGFQYHHGSGLVNGVRVEPTLTGRNISWRNLTFQPGETKTFQLVLTAGISVTPGEYVNQAAGIDPGVSRPVSNVATATVRVVPDPTFDCPDLIGRVFDDTNANGYPDEGEKGLAGVRLVTAQGLLVTTDAEGRYHIACPMLPNAQIGSNYIVKLDERTLPTGYRLTTENPDTVRLTQGKLSKLNFGAALMHTVRIEINASAFDETRLRQTVLDNLSAVASAQDGKPTLATLVYAAGNAESDATVREHLALLHEAVVFAWRTTTGRDPVKIEEDIIRSGATPPPGPPTGSTP